MTQGVGPSNLSANRRQVFLISHQLRINSPVPALVLVLVLVPLPTWSKS